MAEDKITRVESPDGTQSHTTIIREEPERQKSSSGAGWFIGAVLLVALIVGAWFLMQAGGAEVAKDNAIANAADEVGEAAGQAGAAAQQIGDAARDTADDLSN